MYKPKYFCIEELVPPDVFGQRGEKAWELLDERILKAADLLREEFGSITVNNWGWGGDFAESGLRIPNCTYYHTFSQHSYGRALDLKFRHAEPEDVRQYILMNEHEDFNGMIGGMELGTPTWVHIDCRTRLYGKIKVFNP